MDACTIVARRELARARVLVRSYRAHHPSGTFLVVVLDGVEGADTVADATVLTAESLVGSRLGALAAGNTIEGLTAALVPYAVRHTLKARPGTGEAASVVYLGASLRVLGPLEELRALAREHALVIVSRAAASPRAPIAYAEPTGGGAIDHRVLACRRASTSEGLLARWPTYFAGEEQQAVYDWFDSIPAVGEDVAVLRDPGYGLDECTLSAERLDGGEELCVEGRPAKLIDLGWLDPRAPLRANAVRKDARLDSIAALSRLRVRHAEELLACGYEKDAERSWRFATLDGAAPMTELMRGLWRAGVEEGRLGISPFEGDGRDDFNAYLNEAAQIGAADGLSRLHLAIWRLRPDLQAAFPHLDGPDGRHFAVWLCEHAREDHDVPDALLPWAACERVRAQALPRPAREPLWGVNVAGFFDSERGLGEAARLLLAGLDACGVPTLPVQARLVPAHSGVDAVACASPRQAPYSINVVCVNGELVGPFAREAGEEFFRDRHTIALWWWELGEFPESWMQAFAHLDEVWVGSQHVYDAVAPRSPVPVVKMRMPVAVPGVPDRSRAELGMPEEGFLFLYVHDYHSTAARKNPLGVVEAFKRAFPLGSGAELVVKSMNAKDVIHEHDRVVLAAEGRPDITLIDAFVPAAEKNAMIAACDCYISLHRSEGFGLTVAEAMLLGKPVIATDYGGNLEFMNERNSYLVSWQPVAVGPDAHPYPADAIWADPDLEEAARLMKEVLADPQAARERGQRGQREVARRHAPRVAGEQMEARLRLLYEQLIHEEPPGQRAGEVGGDILQADSELRRLISGGPLPTSGSGTGPTARRIVRRLVAQLARTFGGRRRAIDSGLYEELLGVQQRVQQLADDLGRRQVAHLGEALAGERRLSAEIRDLRVALEMLERHQANSPQSAGEPHSQESRERVSRD